uniref:Uncharacterized protein n=1 Tax=Talaromyces marneffei PM1 TaxID=1077442 RepID=A0A093V801_TALMA
MQYDGQLCLSNLTDSLQQGTDNPSGYLHRNAMLWLCAAVFALV